MTASPPDSPSGEVWCYFIVEHPAWYWVQFTDEGGEGVAVRYLRANEAWMMDAHHRSRLPVPSAVRIAALENLAEVVAFARDYNTTSHAAGEHAALWPKVWGKLMVALERLKGCEK